MSRRSSVVSVNCFPGSCPRLTVLTVPSASTTSTPSTHLRTLPYLTVLGPAAFVATMPPLVAKAPEDGSGGRRRPYGLAASFSWAHVTAAPAPTGPACPSTPRAEDPTLE